MRTETFDNVRTRELENMRTMYAYISKYARNSKYADIYDAYQNILNEIEVQAKMLKKIRQEDIMDENVNYEMQDCEDTAIFDEYLDEVVSMYWQAHEVDF